MDFRWNMELYQARYTNDVLEWAMTFLAWSNDYSIDYKWIESAFQVHYFGND
ncbi:MAG: hypothetical protein O3B75_03050 [Planctomycetota bacterium]|nr:hypothetical protein [Planctomycetota bacterium]